MRSQKEKRRESKAGQNRRSEYSKKKRRILIYGLGTMGLVLLVIAAFFGPQIVFAVQDDIRCGAVVAMSQEEVDITSFNTGYETDLYKRLERFAEGLAEGRQYYVTVQDMELTSEVADWMASEQGFMRDSYQLFVWNMGLIPETLFGYNLIAWKRCVIYGDDYAGGVNFILWYLELGNNDEPVARLLVDGETGDLYGIRTNFDSYFPDNGGEEVNADLVDYFGIYDENMFDLSIVIGEYFAGLEIVDMVNWLYSMNGDIYSVDGLFYVDIPADYDILWEEKTLIEENLGKTPDYEWMNRYSMEEIQNTLSRLQWRVSEAGRCLDFEFPYEESILDFRIRLDGKIRNYDKWGTRFLDITYGFPEIYERVPAFMEDWD